MCFCYGCIKGVYEEKSINIRVYVLYGGTQLYYLHLRIDKDYFYMEKKECSTKFKHIYLFCNIK